MKTLVLFGFYFGLSTLKFHPKIINFYLSSISVWISSWDHKTHKIVMISCGFNEEDRQKKMLKMFVDVVARVCRAIFINKCVLVQRFLWPELFRQIDASVGECFWCPFRCFFSVWWTFSCCFHLNLFNFIRFLFSQFNFPFSTILFQHHSTILFSSWHFLIFLHKSLAIENDDRRKKNSKQNTNISWSKTTVYFCRKEEEDFKNPLHKLMLQCKLKYLFRFCKQKQQITENVN